MRTRLASVGLSRSARLAQSVTQSLSRTVYLTQPVSLGLSLYLCREQSVAISQAQANQPYQSLNAATQAATHSVSQSITNTHQSILSRQAYRD